MNIHINQTEKLALAYADNQKAIATLEALRTDFRADLPTSLPVRSIIELKLFSHRSGLNEYHVQQLKRLVANDTALDPILILPLGGMFFLVDGHHRLAAYAALGRTSAIPVAYFDGSPREALTHSLEVNSRLSLTLDNQQRQNGAWKLVRIGGFTSKEIIKATGISKPQVTIMRKALQMLGEDANGYEEWWAARKAAKGESGANTADFDPDAELEEQSDVAADRMARAFSTHLADRPRLMAMTLEKYMGRRLGELVQYLSEYVDGDQEYDDDDLVPF